MAMESFGGDLPAGQPVTVSSGNRTHVFAIAKGGSMNHWISTGGGPWSGPSILPGGNLAASVPCVIALADGSVHVFAIGQGGLFTGGPLTWWNSIDGINWNIQFDQSTQIPANGNGLAVASSNGQQIEVFATTSAGIIQYSIIGSQAVARGALLDSVGFPPRLLAAVSSAPGTLDVFAIDPQIHMPLHWRFNGAWSKQLIGGAVHANSGITAISAELGRVDLFGITSAGTMMAWSVEGMMAAAKPFVPALIPAGSWALPVGIPAVVARGRRLDLFAIGQGGILNGGPLVRWQFDGTWREPEAYDSGLAAGGVGAVRSAFGIDVFGIQSGTSNPLLHWPAGISGYGPGRWNNWAGNRETNPVEGHCRPTCLEELVAIVRTATQQEKRVRAVGSSWSFGDIATTPGYVVETNRLKKVLDTVSARPGSPRPRWLPAAQIAKIEPIVPEAIIPAPHHFIHVEAGIQLEDLMTFLDVNMMAPATMGGASGQTLAGVLSTSVHGSHFRLPPISDWVRAIHLVGPDGMQYWIEPADRPITDPTDLIKLQEALGPEVMIKHDNDWFDTCLVTVGSLGIIYSVVLEVRDQYMLSETRTKHTWSELKIQLEDSSVFAANTDCVAIAIDPGSVGNNDPVGILAKRVAIPFDSLPAGKPAFDALGAFCEGDLILELLFEAAKVIGTPNIVIPALLVVLPTIPAVAALAALFPPALFALTVLTTAAAGAATTVAAATSILYPLLKAAGPGAVGDVVGSVLDRHPEIVGSLASLVTMQFQGPTDQGPIVGIAHNVMGPRNKGECATRGLGLEIAFAADGSHIRFIDAVLALLKDEAAMGRMLGGWISIRFVGKSRAILSPQQTAMTCMVEFVGLRTLSSTNVLFGKLEALGRTHGGIQHWGMFFDENNLTASDVTRAYPRLSTWKQIRRELTTGNTVRTFDNNFTLRCGLSDPPVRILRVEFDPPGDDVAGELVIIRNETAAAVTLTGWTLRDAANHVFTFPSFVLQGGSDVNVWTRRGANDTANLFWGRRSAVWNNTGDTAMLRDQHGTEVAKYVY